MVEKPFGRDLRTAQLLNQRLLSNFAEHQIFRIDHYLAKETVQNVLAFRLANTIFEPLWNRNHVDHVRIIAAETLGVEQRAGYYEEAGVLRDMLQNHMMQLLAVTAIEPPARWESERVRDERAKLFQSLQPLPLGLDVYAKVLLDCMAGDHMLFWRQDGIEESWRFLEPVLSRCETCTERVENLHFYPAGSAGPQRALEMMPPGRG